MNKVRNGLIDLLKFIFAFFVLIAHHLIPLPKGMTSFWPGRTAVEFFFLVSGFLFARTLLFFESKQDASIKDVFKYLLNRMKKLGIPVLICLILSTIRFFILVPDQGLQLVISNNLIFGYLWYIAMLLLVTTFILLFRIVFKNNKVFYTILICAALGCYIARSFPPLVKNPFLRGISSIITGIFISKIPHCKNKILNWIFIILCFSLVLFDTFSGFGNDITLMITLYLILPALVYFGFNIELNSKVLTTLGILSLDMYIFQEVPRFLRDVFNIKHLYILLIAYVASILINNIIKYTHYELTQIKRK